MVEGNKDDMVRLRGPALKDVPMDWLDKIKSDKRARWLGGLLAVTVLLAQWALIKSNWLFVFLLAGLITFSVVYGTASEEAFWRRLIMALIVSAVVSFFVSLPWL